MCLSEGFAGPSSEMPCSSFLRVEALARISIWSPESRPAYEMTLLLDCHAPARRVGGVSKKVTGRGEETFGVGTTLISQSNCDLTNFMASTQSDRPQELENLRSWDMR